MNTTIASIEEMKSFAQSFLNSLKINNISSKKAVVVGLSGDLGSGKTTFSQCVAEILGITEKVTSPTFVIEKIYKIKNYQKDNQTKDLNIFETFIHIDAYRLENAKEVEVLGFRDIVASTNTLVFIEWPEKIKEALPNHIISLNFKFIDENTREISYK